MPWIIQRTFLKWHQAIDLVDRNEESYLVLDWVVEKKMTVIGIGSRTVGLSLVIPKISTEE